MEKREKMTKVDVSGGNNEFDIFDDCYQETRIRQKEAKYRNESENLALYLQSNLRQSPRKALKLRVKFYCN